MAAQLQAESDGNTVTVSDAFRQLRRALRRSGSELVILVEDVVTFQGLERTLLDAFIEPPDADTCRLRALVASTGGHWSRLIDDVGTLENRLGPTYGLALQPAGAAESRALLMRLAGSYLNAARVGAKELQKAYTAVREEDRNAWVAPSACEPCKFRTRCHAAFGTASPRSGLNVGLFPLNGEALSRAYAVAAEKAQLERDVVNPRLVVRHVLFPVLSEATAVKEGLFPSPPIRDAFSKPAQFADVKAGLVSGPRRSENDRDRAALALELWGKDVDDSRSLADEVAVALGLEALPSVATGTTVAPDEPDPVVKQRTSALSTAIADWRNTGVMTQAHANEARALVFQACVSRIPWPELAGETPTSPGDSGIARELGLRTHEHSVSIELENQVAERPAGHTLVAEIQRDDDGYQLLQSLARFNLPRDDGEGVDGAALLRVAEAIEPIVDSVVSHARSAGFSREHDIDAGGPTPRALLTTSLLLGGMRDPTAGAVGMARAMLMPDPAPVEDSPLASISKIALDGVRPASGETFGGRTFSRDTAREWLLRRVVIRQSLMPTAGEVPRIIDAGRLIPLVGSLQESGARLEPVAALKSRKTLSDPGESAVRLAESVEGKALDSAMKSLQQRWAEVRKRADEYGVTSDSPDEWLEALMASVKAAISMIQGLREVRKEPAGMAYTTVKDVLRDSDSTLRRTLAPSERVNTGAVLQFGLGLHAVTTRSVEHLAAVGAYASDADQLGNAIVDFHDNLLPASENARNLLESSIGHDHPIVASFDGEFEQAVERVEAALK